MNSALKGSEWLQQSASVYFTRRMDTWPSGPMSCVGGVGGPQQPPGSQQPPRGPSYSAVGLGCGTTDAGGITCTSW